MSKNTEFSLVITAHSEGLLAHKTMLSVYAALKNMPAECNYEIIISIDNGDAVTKTYFERYKVKPGHTVVEVDFKDLSASRNNAVNLAKGELVAFLDADDLVSSNWFKEALALSHANENAIIHPEYSVTFDEYNLIWKKRNSGNLTTDTLCLVDNNIWDSPLLTKKSVLIEHPYHPLGSGIGYEDKHFNCQTLAHDIPHLVATDTVLFVRRKSDGSLLTQSTGSRVTVAPTDLLSFGAVQNLDLTFMDTRAQETPSRKLPYLLAKKLLHKSTNLAMRAHSKAVQYPAYERRVHSLREKRQAYINGQMRTKFTPTLLEEWKAIHKIENLIFPSKALLKSIPWYNAESISAGVSYAKTIQTMRKKPDSLFFVPHLVKGGADKVFVNYLSHLEQVQPEWIIAMLQTESTESVWADKVPNSVDFINFNRETHELDTATSLRVLATLVTQLGIKRIIIGNSQLAYDFCATYKTLLSALDVKIYCFAFGEEFDDEGRLWGLVHTGIPKIYPQIYRIITDNNNIVNKLQREYGFEPKKFTVHYQPTDLELQPTNHTNNLPLKIMWASRVCKQKRPDILKAVSNQLDSSKYVIDAYGQLEEGLTPEYFADSRVDYKGPFNGAGSLPVKEYDMFLYTSEGDGVPNMLQEMTALGLPIVASNVGGIKEFIEDGKTGKLIVDHEVIEDYVSAIENLSDWKLRESYNQQAQTRLNTTFSKKVLLERIKQDFDK